ncbi:hypothetical protein PILCRDRAFT_827405 [Piloderma croceum F 1598]|uniref:Uncharacterized protein n=1 Tax=Piloderma croceum (strain F 1598) TaxID=765440 RepID=A0A0C3F5Y4_PILCF|nr:hypothetical protein PILCRDRAFT_827405 [Piloderma croceum F 1598]
MTLLFRHLLFPDSLLRRSSPSQPLVHRCASRHLNYPKQRGTILHIPTSPFENLQDQPVGEFKVGGYAG